MSLRGAARILRRRRHNRRYSNDGHPHISCMRLATPQVWRPASTRSYCMMWGPPLEPRCEHTTTRSSAFTTAAGVSSGLAYFLPTSDCNTGLAESFRNGRDVTARHSALLRCIAGCSAAGIPTLIFSGTPGGVAARCARLIDLHPCLTAVSCRSVHM